MLNSDEQSLAESKILLLYIISKVNKPISHNELLELVISTVDMNYFYFEQFLLDLLEDNYVYKFNEDNNEIYEITDEGKNAIALTINIVPGIQKLQIDSKFKENMDSVKDKFAISAEYTPISEKVFSVKCKIMENSKIIFSLQTEAGSPEQAKQIAENWKTNCTNIYPQILELLIGNY